MMFSVLRRRAAYALTAAALALFMQISPGPQPLLADETGGGAKSSKSETKPEASKEAVSETDAVELQACCDAMNKLVPKLKFKDMAAHENFSEIGRRIKRIANALKNGGVLFSPDGTAENVPLEKLDKMLADENERLEEAKKALSRTQKELDEMTAAAQYIESGSPEKPAICPAKGVYTLTQDEKLRYRIKCGVHGGSEEIRAKLYEKAMKNTEPGRFCRGNMSAIVGACERYAIDYGVPAEWRTEELIEEGYLEGEYVCPAGGVYEIKGGGAKDFTCSCSVHK
ncbi:MAG TPA: hypothetical protein PKW98_00685 [Candidatus Wallbacteria bacterium]|nr:MAG: hypothetical protein BWY32_00282 [bacterium ADurb.Bin243]HPG56304.1 hypothetical protein [Candidatus Wallbacteria bacterium]